MIILQVVPYFYPAWRYGGPTKLVYNISRSLVSLGHDVTVLTTDVYTAEQRMPTAAKVASSQHLRVYYDQILSNWLADRLHIFVSLPLMVRAVEEIRRADCVHLHDFFTTIHIWCFWWARWWGTPYVVSVHGTLESQAQAQKSLFKRVFLVMVGRSMLRHAAYVIASSPTEVAQYRAQGVPKPQIKQLGHGVDVTELDCAVSKRMARQQLHLPARATVVTFLGRFHQYKGLAELLAAVARSRARSLVVVIAGADDGFLGQMTEIIQANQKLRRTVRILGPQAGEAKALLFRASDIFVYPSFVESFSMAILEAASAGLALLISPGCHFPLVARAGAGKIVPVVPAKMQKALDWMVAHPSWVRQAGQKARRLVQQSFSQQRITTELCSIYQQAHNDYAHRYHH